MMDLAHVGTLSTLRRRRSSTRRWLVRLDPCDIDGVRRTAIGAALLALVLVGACRREAARFTLPICDSVDTNCRCAIAGWIVCGKSCIDPAVDRDNCGACGTRCGAQQCAAGTCVDACPGAACGDRCTYPDDPYNCGGCGNVCAWSCVGGTCKWSDLTHDLGSTDLARPDLAPMHCDPGLTPCNGACIDLQTDSHHCGSCTKNCWPAGSTSDYFTCGGGQCCTNGIFCNDKCVDPSWDWNNCGDCGIACQYAGDCIDGHCH
jgi:hypothetical protein